MNKFLLRSYYYDLYFENKIYILVEIKYNFKIIYFLKSYKDILF